MSQPAGGDPDVQGRGVHTPEIHDPFAAFRVRDYRFYMGYGFLSALIQQVQAVALGWDIYERTGSAWALGWIGLVQFAPVVLLFLPAGQIADRYDRRYIVVVSLVLWSASSLGLALVSNAGAHVGWIYVCAAATAAALMLNRPARDALLTQIVLNRLLPNAVAWNTTVFQVATISGPALAGILIAVTGSATVVYAINFGCALAALSLAACIGQYPPVHAQPARSLRELFAGLSHVWRQRTILGVLTLDLMAVLFGGATALLPIYAKDILQVGPAGLGWLASAPAIGAVAMAAAQGYRPPLERSGRAFFLGVVFFGVATVVFGLSTWFWVSMAALIVLGAADNISVVIRHTVVQLYTPDALRGRVSAVNRVFISSSNELGAFESGAVAALTSPVFAVVSGGIATILFVAIGLRWFPELRHLGRLGK
ncbi:MAG: MFS transporter [Betaproteobacteria bacterium]|nr:MFS transporter [Betaproteobacteria bacterium]